MQSLTPLYDILSDDFSSTPAAVVKGRRRGEERETKNPKKSGASMPLKFVLATVVIVGAVIASKRVRLPHFNWSSKWASRHAILAFTEPGPSFAATRRLPSQGPQEGFSSRLSRVVKSTVHIPIKAVGGTLTARTRFLQAKLSRTRVTPEDHELQATPEEQLWDICRAEADVVTLQERLSVLRSKPFVSV